MITMQGPVISKSASPTCDMTASCALQCHAVCEGNPPSPNNATFDCGTTSSPGGVCNATCDQGFGGAPSSTCGDDGLWGAVNGTCEPIVIGM